MKRFCEPLIPHYVWPIGGQLHYNTVNSNYTAIQTEQYNEILKMSCNTLTGNHLGLSINPNSPYGSLQDQGEGCDQQDYRPANAFIISQGTGKYDIKSSIYFKYYENMNNPNHALQSMVLWTTPTSGFIPCNNLTSPDPACTYEPLPTQTGSHDNANNLRYTIDTTSDSTQKQFYRNDLMREYLKLDTTQSLMTALLDEMNTHAADQIKISNAYADSDITMARAMLDTLNLSNQDDSIYYEILNLLLSISEDGRAIQQIDSLEKNQLLSLADNNVPSAIIAQNTLEFLSDTLDYRVAIEQWPSAKRGNDEKISTPDKSLLLPNYPNPFDKTTLIPCYLIGKRGVLMITDLAGKVMMSEHVVSGWNYIRIQASQLASGTYIYSLIIEGQTIDSRKMSIY